MQEYFAATGKGRKVDASVDAYLMNTLVGQNHLLQMNRIGAITALTAELSPGKFQVVIRDWRAQQDPDVGWIVAEFNTVEKAEGFHLALIQSLYHGEFGSALRGEASRVPDAGAVRADHGRVCGIPQRECLSFYLIRMRSAQKHGDRRDAAGYREHQPGRAENRFGLRSRLPDSGNQRTDTP